MKSIKKYQNKNIDKYVALRLMREFNGLNSFKINRMVGGSSNSDSYRDENNELKIVDCIDCREDDVLV